MSKGYYLASLLHVLIRFFYGDLQDLTYFFILYSRFLIMRECFWVILIITLFFQFLNLKHLHFLLIMAFNL